MTQYGVNRFDDMVRRHRIAGTVIFREDSTEFQWLLEKARRGAEPERPAVVVECKSDAEAAYFAAVWRAMHRLDERVAALEKSAEAATIIEAQLRFEQAKRREQGETLTQLNNRLQRLEAPGAAKWARGGQA